MAERVQAGAEHFSPSGIQKFEDSVALLARLGEVLHSATTSEELLRGLAGVLQPVLGFQKATLVLPDARRQNAEAIFFSARDEIRSRNTTISWELFLRSARDLTPPGHGGQLTPELMRLLFDEPSESFLITLLPAAGFSSEPNGLELQGALALGSNQAGAFAAVPHDFVSACASLLAFGLERLRLREREAEMGLQKREEELENFVSAISHNLKTPIVSIQGFANFLREELGPQLGQEHLHFLDRIQKNARLMEKMILDLLEFSRLGRKPMKFEWISLQDLVRTVIDEMSLLEQASDALAELNQPQAHRPARAEFILPPHLPQLLAEGSSLKTVFENLFSNAMKYRRPEAPLGIEVGWQEQPRFHAFWVRDNGAGMDEAFLPRAFDLFQRGPNVGHVAGTGVGLAVVRRIIENHKGMVRLDSTPGGGTTVYFTLPKLEQVD